MTEDKQIDIEYANLQRGWEEWYATYKKGKVYYYPDVPDVEETVDSESTVIREVK